MPQPVLALRLAAFGDSLTAGWGLPAADAFPAQLARALAARGQTVEILNFGISGDTTAGGLARLNAVLAAAPDGVILELGANDMLRGMDPATPRANLDAIMGRVHDAGIPIMLCGIAAMRNYGRAYAEELAAVYAELAKKYDAVLYSSFLDGVTGVPGMTLPDGLHPTSQGVAEIVRRILPATETFLTRLGATRPAKP
ncbi:MAG: arylesterase [Acidobacteriota bacterium]